MARFFCSFLLAMIWPSAAVAESICGEPSSRLTMPELARYSQEVRDGFPARYRDLLANVSLRISEEPGATPYVSKGRNSSELVVPSDFPRVACLLMVGAVQLSQAPTVDWAKLRLLIPACPGQPRRELCFLEKYGEELDRGDASEPESVRRSDQYRFLKAMMKLLAESGVLATLAHEYGHIVDDYEKEAHRRSRKGDAELAADIEALHLQANGRSFPAADAILFEGLAFFEQLSGKEGAGASPHEDIACRAKRSATIRQLVLENLGKIHNWRAVPDSVNSTVFNFVSSRMPNQKPTEPFTQSAGNCDIALNTELTMLHSDIGMIATAVAKLPKIEETTQSDLASIERLKPKSEFGKELKSSVLFAPIRKQLETFLGSLFFQKASPTQVQTLEVILPKLYLFKEEGRLSLADYRHLIVLRTLGRFVTQPPKSSFSKNTGQFQADLSPIASHSNHDVNSLLPLLLASIANADCGSMVDRSIQLEDAYSAMRNGVQRALNLTVDESGKISPAMTGWVSELASISRKAKSGGTGLDPEACQTSRYNLRASLKQSKGWTD